ncbi:MAG: DUF4831 family protein [Bacteroidetes bacterium]|nr:DUF4831 family protein [Bacteroidota bacterium]MCL2302571.1 DUF4831 family protein [Lentimicrobiaceae bacterium]
MIKKSLIIFLGLFVSLNVYAQKAVHQLPVTSKTDIANPTFFYTLPKTAFKVEVVVTKTTNIKGLYVDFAEKLLGITNYCKENSVSFELKNILLTPFSVPDETLQFVAELSSAQIKNNFLQTLHANNATAGFQTFSTLEQNNTNILPDFFKNFADVVMQQTYETYTETKIIDGVVTQVPVTQTKVTTKTLAQQAQAAVDFIEKIRDDRYAILSFAQETTLEKEAFEYLINQLDELEKKYLELFIGVTVLEDFHEIFIIHPNSNYALQSVCSVAPTSGFSTSMSKTNAYNYYLKCTPIASTDLKVNFNEAFSANPKHKNTGYRLRKAVPVSVTLVHGDSEEALLGIFPIYQYGFLETLPANLDAFEIWRWGYSY